MKKLFVDTGAWYALVDRNDPGHVKAREYFKLNELPLITTNFIFGEIVTLLMSRLGWSVAKNFGQRLKDSNFVSLISVKNEDEERGWEIFLKYKDKHFSYTDCTSFAVKQKIGSNLDRLSENSTGLKSRSVQYCLISKDAIYNMI